MTFDDAAAADDESDDYNSFPSHQPTASTQRTSGYPFKKRRRLDEDDPRETEHHMVSARLPYAMIAHKACQTLSHCVTGALLSVDSLACH